jgi:hypothetical protein
MKMIMIALAAMSAPCAVQAQTVYILTKQWIQNGQNFCQYSDGTVINVGYRACPSTIPR